MCKIVAFEYAKLQEALHAMWLLVEEANSDVIREQEAARKAIEEAPPQVIKETSEDTEKINSLTSEVEALKASLQSERQAAEDLRKAFSEAEARNLELATKLENVMRRVDQLCDLTSLQSDQQAADDLRKALSQAEARNSELTTKLENVTRRVDQLCELASLQSEQQSAEDLRKALSQAEARNSELTTKLENVTRRVDQLCESESQEVLVKCISQNLGYDGGKPVVACVIYKCLLHWRSFEVERTNIFDRIVKIIASAIEVSDNNKVLAYWLSNSAMLVCLLQQTFRSSTMPSPRGFIRDDLVSSLDRQIQVVPKYPAMLFKKQLIDFLEKIYGMMRDNLKKEIIPLLEYCTMDIVKPKSWECLLAKYCGNAETVPEYNESKQCSTLPSQQIFFYIMSVAQYTMGSTLMQYAGSAWDELRHIRQAVDFLVTYEKWKMTLEEITRELCPVLSIQQLYRISTIYRDEAHGLSYDVKAKLRVMVDSNHAVRSSFLLADDSSIPFAVEDLSKIMLQVDVNDIVSQLIHENPCFSFLLTRKEGSP
ncbi:unnamed protein product [Arabidopsis halleri]